MRYTVTVKFRQDYVRQAGSSLVVGIRARPEAGKANTELIQKLARYFDVTQAQIRIVAGLTSNRKVIEVA